jgi:hypothetical protein
VIVRTCGSLLLPEPTFRVSLPASGVSSTSGPVAAEFGVPKPSPALLGELIRAPPQLLPRDAGGRGCQVQVTARDRSVRSDLTVLLSEGQRTGALRFGDVRVMALAGALCQVVNAVAGFTNRSLRARLPDRLAPPTRCPDGLPPQAPAPARPHRATAHTNTYVPTPDGIRVGLFYTKVQARVLTPLLAADHPPARAGSSRPSHHRPRRR